MRFAPLPLLLVACGAAPRTPATLRPSDIVEYASLPPGYERSEQLVERCTGATGLRTIEHESLLSVDCSSERLTQILRARAAERGAQVLVERTCRASAGQRYQVRCAATIATPTSQLAFGVGPGNEFTSPAPSPSMVRDLDEPRPQHSPDIFVSFLPAPEARPLPTRAYDRVAEIAVPSVGRRGVGQVSAGCAHCEPSELRHALRVTAGRMGAGEVAAVRCFADDGPRCVATAFEPWTF